MCGPCPSFPTGALNKLIASTSLGTSTLYYQKALLTSGTLQTSPTQRETRSPTRTELESIFASAPASPQNVMSARITEAYKKVQGEDVEEEDSKTEAQTQPEDAVHGKRRLPQEGDTCPVGHHIELMAHLCPNLMISQVCYEDFEPGQADSLVFCSDSCGGGLHQQCFQQWSLASSGNVTCVYCRAPWPQPAAPVASGGGPHVSEVRTPRDIHRRLECWSWLILHRAIPTCLLVRLRRLTSH